MKRNITFASPRTSTNRGTLHAAHPPPHEDGATMDVFNAVGGHAVNVASDDEASREAVDIDATVEIRDLASDELEVYTLVLPEAADIRRNRISSFTPIGRALFGRRVGDIVEVEAPTGAVNIRIESIHYSAN